MKIDHKYYRSIWFKDKEEGIVQIIDQRPLPHKLVIEDLRSMKDCGQAIREMHVRGAPLIGVTAAFGMYFAVREALQSESFQKYIGRAFIFLAETRPTAVDLFYVLRRMQQVIDSHEDLAQIEEACLQEALSIADESAEQCRQIGLHGLPLIETVSKIKGGDTVNILTHCNAGWLATVDYGTALAPIYAAFDKGIKVHVWVDETRPRNQGARLTAFELLHHGVPHTVIPDNTGGHLMQHGMVDMVIVGSDRTTRTGDVCNKIGTYLKALAAKDNEIPFYVALPVSSFDFALSDGLREIPIEQRSGREVKYIYGVNEQGAQEVLLTPSDSPVANYAFDVTPARLVSALITDRGICQSNEKSIARLFDPQLVIK
ncbi:MAG: S-methyl-5-thioribose-1-phosphate isomerase [Saprospiraceae bacterium]|nr:S-methyl-5-thioribose-1-phosphate isomerase [Saprospiraceae bacterium]MCB9323957.1 S-methyl-5-thioribose-1-phosphate isomerase [Lewinellaceae bacterium]